MVNHFMNEVRWVADELLLDMELNPLDSRRDTIIEMTYDAWDANEGYSYKQFVNYHAKGILGNLLEQWRKEDSDAGYDPDDGLDTSIKYE